MPQLLLLGVPNSLAQNVVAALPTRASITTAPVALETSFNQSVWSAFPSNGQTSAPFVRCPSANTTVICKAIGSSSGGAAAVTIPEPLVLSSAVAGEPAVVLIDEAQPIDQRRWRIQALPGGYLCFDSENDAGALSHRGLYIAHATGNLTCSQAINGYVVQISNRLEMSEVPFSTIGLAPGALANISDSTVNTIGATIAGGGSFKVLGRCNGTVWKVIGV